MKNYIVLGIAVLSGLLAFALAQNHYRKEERRLGMIGEKVVVLAASRKIRAGEVLSSENTTMFQIFRRMVDKNVIVVQGETKQQRAESLRKIYREGYTFDEDLDKNEFIRWRHFNISSEAGVRTFADNVPPRQRALSVPVDATSSVSNLIRTNNKVDIIATFQFPQNRSDLTLATVTLTLLQNVTVLSVGQRYSSGGPSGRGYSNITLAVEPKEAELLVFAMQKGKLHFTLRAPRDIYFEDDIQSVDFEYLKENIKKYLEERKAAANR